MKRGWKFAVIVGVLAVLGCGGGSKGSGPALSNDACSVLGLKIINGTACPAMHSPVVSFDVTYNSQTVTSCSGTMITSRDVLTACHCFAGDTSGVEGITVFAGAASISTTDYSVHPGCEEVQSPDVPSGDAIFNDVAIIHLGSDAPVPTVPLLTSRSTKAGDVISIFGYGYDENGSLGTLKSGEMLVDSVTTDHVIADFNGDGSNTCQGDSGGPAIYSGGGVKGIVGITSSGDPNAQCMEGDVSLFANIQDPSILSFILSVVPNAPQV